MRILAFQPGINSDNGTGYSVQAHRHPDRIFARWDFHRQCESNGAQTEIFPSAEGIAEMKVQGVGNNAEYGQVGDITTIPAAAPTNSTAASSSTCRTAP